MSVDLCIAVQIKEDDKWKTISFSDKHSSVYMCGRWFQAFIDHAHFNGSGLPCDPKEAFFDFDGSLNEYGWGYSHCTLDDYKAFLEKREAEIYEGYAREMLDYKLRKLESKVDCLLNNAKYVEEETDEYYYDPVEYFKDEINDLICAYRIEGYAQNMAELYREGDYIRDSDIRLIFFFS